MKKKAELIEDVEKAEKLAQHWKRKADKYLNKLEGVESSFQNTRKMADESEKEIAELLEKISKVERHNESLYKSIDRKKFLAEDVVELIDDLSLSDFTFFLSHFLRNICFSLQLKEDNEENDTRNVILHLDERHDQPIAYGGDVYLHLVPNDHADCRVKFRRDLTMYDMEKDNGVE
jgi:hypothetical protein